MTEPKTGYPVEHPNLVILADQYVAWKHIESLVDDLEEETHQMYSHVKNREFAQTFMFLKFDAQSHIRAIEDTLHNMDRRSLE